MLSQLRVSNARPRFCMVFVSEFLNPITSFWMAVVVAYIEKVADVLQTVALFSIVKGVPYRVKMIYGFLCQKAWNYETGSGL